MLIGRLDAGCALMSIVGNNPRFLVIRSPIGQPCPSLLQFLSHGVEGCDLRVVMCAGLVARRAPIFKILCISC